MKTVFNIKSILTLLIVSILFFPSCKKYLQEDPLTTFGTDYVFGDVSDAYKVVIGAYGMLAGDNGYGIRLSMYYPNDADDILGPTGATDGDRRDINRYAANASNTQLLNPFNQLFKGIEYANICIANIPNMALYKNGTASQKGELQRLYGESLTLRAQFYFEAVRNWGDLPAQWVPSSQLPNLFLPRTNRDTIYNHLLNDLLLAESIVPWRTEITALGDPMDERITKGAVKALRAKIALFRGGYSLRQDTKLMGRTSDYLTYYAIAKQECADIMARTDQHSLDPSFKDLWKNNVCNVSKIQDPYGEIIFQVAMSGGSSATGDSKLGYYDGPRVANAISGTTYTYGRGNGLFIVPTYFYSFNKYDTRRDVTCAPYNVLLDNVTKVGIAITSMADGKFRSDWVTPSVAPTSAAQYFGINWILIRYSDVLLMYAEADNEINNGPSATAISAFENVRKRAFGTNASQIGSTPSTHDAFFSAIVNERWWEFGGEGMRKYDLIRWNLLGQKLADAKTALTALSLFTTPALAPYNSNNRYENLAKSMYYYTTTSLASGDDSTIWANSYYTIAPTVTPTSTSKVSFLVTANIDPTVVGTTFMGRFAQFFTPNKSELLPIPQSVLDANYNFKTQNPNY